MAVQVAQGLIVCPVDLDWQTQFQVRHQDNYLEAFTITPEGEQVRTVRRVSVVVVKAETVGWLILVVVVAVVDLPMDGDELVDQVFLLCQSLPQNTVGFRPVRQL